MVTAKRQKLIMLLACFLLMTGMVYTQETGTIRGTITDATNGELLMFANALVKGTDPPVGVQTDLDGNYEIVIAPGTYEIEISYIGFATGTIEGVEVKANEVTVLDYAMEEEGVVLAEVVVQAKAIDRTENAILALQRKAPGIQDGISSQEISRYGSSNAAESMKRVVGASVVGGRYVFIRGLGDRYSSAQLNGQSLPSTDPYRNSSALDLIPANLLDNVIASKSFTPNLPGSFTGGNVNIKTKSFPETFTMSLSTSFRFNTITSFRDDFLTHEGGNTDWLGYDDGTRDIPSILLDPKVLSDLTPSAHIRARNDGELASLIDESAKSLTVQKQATEKSVPFDHGIAFSIGNQYQVGGNPLGFLFGVNYSRSFRQFNDGSIANFNLIGRDAPALNEEFNLVSRRGTENPQLGGLFNLAYKFGGSNKISFNALYNHDTEKVSSFQSGPYPGIIAGDFLFETRALNFREREMQSYQLTGENVIKAWNNTKIEWGGSYVKNTQDEPDLRFFANTFNAASDQYLITQSEYDLPFHFWRTLQDDQYLGKVDFTIPFAQEKSSANKIQFGALYRSKDRDFEELRYQIQNTSGNFEPYDGDPDAFFGPSNTGLLGQDNGRNQIGLFATEETRPENSYTGNETVSAGYAMFTYDWPKFKIIAGARIETTDFEVISRDEFQDPGTINETDILPSLNLVYKVTEKMNVRGTFSQTVARPNLREMAPFSSFDFIGGFIFTGNPVLERTLIQNYDLRWELFPNTGELVAVSGYFKNFNDPIITRFLLESLNPEIKADNVDNATVFGVEIELRKNLGFIADWLTNFKFATNFSIISSESDVNAEEVEVNRNFVTNTPTTRPFPGQSDILFNAGINYFNIDNGIDALLSFNFFSERLSDINRFIITDIYEQPRPQLDFTFKKTFERFSTKILIQNLLDTNFRRDIPDYNGRDYVIEEYQRGTTFGVTFSYNIR